MARKFSASEYYSEIFRLNISIKESSKLHYYKWPFHRIHRNARKCIICNLDFAATKIRMAMYFNATVDYLKIVRLNINGNVYFQSFECKLPFYRINFIVLECAITNPDFPAIKMRKARNLCTSEDCLKLF
jgi:hypothetical protein